MEVTIQKVSPLGRRIKFDIPRADLNQKIDQQMRSLAKSTFVPGFRKGKVPKAVLQRKYGAAIRREAMASLVNERISLVLKEHEIAPVTPPFITDFSSDGLECFLYFEVSPEIIETELLGQRTVRPKVRITPKTVDDEIDALKTQFQKWKTVERPAERGDRIFARIKLSELTGNKSILVDDSGDRVFQIRLTSEHTEEEIIEACVGQSVGNVFSVNSLTPQLFLTDEREQLRQELLKQSFVFEISISRIEKPLKDQYHKRLYETFDIKSVHDEDFREKVYFSLNKQIVESVYVSLVEQIQFLLMHVNKFEPSEYLVLQGMVSTLQSQKYAGDQIEKMFRNENQSAWMQDLRQNTAVSLKWALIEQKFMEKFSPEQLDQLKIESYTNPWAMPLKDDEEKFSAEGDSVIVGWESNDRSLVNHVLSKSECQEIEMSLEEFDRWMREYHPVGREHHHPHDHDHHHHHHHHHHHEHHEDEGSEAGEHGTVQNMPVGDSSAEQTRNLVPGAAQMRSVIYSQFGITMGNVAD